MGGIQFAGQGVVCHPPCLTVCLVAVPIARAQNKEDDGAIKADEPVNVYWVRLQCRFGGGFVFVLFFCVALFLALTLGVTPLLSFCPDGVDCDPVQIMFEKDGNPTEGLNFLERNSAYGTSSEAGEVNAMVW